VAAKNLSHIKNKKNHKCWGVSITWCKHAAFFYQSTAPKRSLSSEIYK
jgi:hypothetical protein